MSIQFDDARVPQPIRDMNDTYTDCWKPLLLSMWFIHVRYEGDIMASFVNKINSVVNIEQANIPYDKPTIWSNDKHLIGLMEN